MTSESEGWGMSLIESLQNGVIPVAFDSFASLHEIINDGSNGFIAQDNNIEDFIQKIEGLMFLDLEDLYVLQRQAIESVERFSIDKIMKNWYSLFEN